MMIRPDKQTLQSIESLRGNRDWENVMTWLRKSLGQIFIECGTFSPESARYPFNAGRNAELREIINAIDKARETLISTP